MMKVEEINVVTIDGVGYDVSEMSDNIKRIVAIYNEWRQERADAQLRLMQIDAAIRDLSREIVDHVQKELAAAKESEAADVPAEAADVPAEAETATPVDGDV